MYEQNTFSPAWILVIIVFLISIIGIGSLVNMHRDCKRWKKEVDKLQAQVDAQDAQLQQWKIRWQKEMNNK